MRRALKNFALALTILVVSVPTASAGGELLEGCLAVKGNEQRFKKTTVKWIADRQGETIIVYAVTNVEDKLAVCGMYLNKGAVPQADLKYSLSNGEIQIGRQTLIRNLSFFKNACNGGGCKLCAPCYMTSLDWKSAYGRAKLSLIPSENFQLR